MNAGSPRRPARRRSSTRLVHGDADKAQIDRDVLRRVLRRARHAGRVLPRDRSTRSSSAHLLARGALRAGGAGRCDPGAITRTALLTVEGERDDICGIGPDAGRPRPAARASTRSSKRHHLQAGVGHYGVFSGSRWQTPDLSRRAEVHPRQRLSRPAGGGSAPSGHGHERPARSTRRTALRTRRRARRDPRALLRRRGHPLDHVGQSEHGVAVGRARLVQLHVVGRNRVHSGAYMASAMVGRPRRGRGRRSRRGTPARWSGPDRCRPGPHPRP